MLRSKWNSTKRLRSAAALLFFSAAVACRAGVQGTPVPFINTYAGGGTACAAGIPVYATTGTGKNVGDGCPATQATLNTPIAAVTDRYGNVFIGDQSNDLLRVVYNGGSALAAALVASNIQTTGLVPQPGHIYTAAGGVTTIPAVQTTYYCNQQGTGTVANDRELNGCPGVQAYIQPRGLAVDGDGNVFISNLGTASQISVFYIGGTKAAALITLENPAVTNPIPGYTYRVAGTATAGYTGDNGLATKANVNTPRGLYIDASENIYFADTSNNVIRRVDSGTGYISTVAGHCVVSGTNCTATATSGDGLSATSTSVNIDTPYGVVLDANGNMFIAEGGTSSVPGRIRVVYAAGTVPGLSGPTVGFIYSYAGAGSGSTPALQAVFQLVYGVSIDPSGYLYVTDYRSGSTGSNKIWRVDPTSGNIVVWAGNGGSALTSGAHCNGGSTGPTATDTRGDGCPATQAYLNNPQESLTFDGAGNSYIADRNNNVIRSFNFNNSFKATNVASSLTQQVAIYYPAATTVTGSSFTLQGLTSTEFASASGASCAGSTTFATATTCVYNITFTPAYAGARNGTFSVVGATNTTVATLSLSGQGTGALPTIDPGTSSTLGSGLRPVSVAADEGGDIYVGDGTSRNVYRASGGSGTLIAVLQTTGTPGEITVDPAGDVFAADTTAGKINEAITAAQGGGTASFGTGLSGPQGVASDSSGNLYVADTGNNRLLYLSPATGAQRVVSLPGITLNAPTCVALDAAGDVYVLDTSGTRLVELPVNGTAQALSLPTGVQATAFVFDPAGNVLVSDNGSDEALLITSGLTQFTVVASGLTTPVGVAIAPSGNVYVADSAATSILALNRSLDTTSFATTNIGLSSLPVTLNLNNEGSASTALMTPIYTATGSPSEFPLQSSSSCTAGQTLVSGGSCTTSFEFQPSSPNLQSTDLSFAFTAGQGLQADFSATATNLILSSLMLTLSPSSTTTYGQPLTLNVTLSTASMGASSPGGTIQLVVDGKLTATQMVSGTQYSFPLSLAVGTHALSVSYSGDSLYASRNASTSAMVGKASTTTAASYMQSAAGTNLAATVTPGTTGALSATGTVNFWVDGQQVASAALSGLSASSTVLIADGPHSYYATYSGDGNYSGSGSTTGTLTVARTPTAVTLSILPISSGGTGVLQLTANVQSAGSITPTGSVTFSDNGVTLGKINLNGTSAVYTTTTVSFTNYAFTASYSGDGLFQPSSVVVTEGPDFVVVTPTTSLTVPQGSVATESVAVTSIHGYSGTFTASCSNLPSNALCRFQPVPLSVASGATTTLSVQVFVGINPNVADAAQPFRGYGRGPAVLALLLPLCLLGRGRRRGLRAWCCVLLLTGLVPVVMGCGNKTPAYPTGTYVTPIGTTAVTVTLTDANGLSRSATFNVVVNSD